MNSFRHSVATTRRRNLGLIGQKMRGGPNGSLSMCRNESGKPLIDEETRHL